MEHKFIQLIFNDDAEIETEKNNPYINIIFGDLWQYLDQYDWFFYDTCVLLSEKNETIQVTVGCDEYEEGEDEEGEDYEPPRQGTVWLYFDDKLNFIESDGALD